MAAFDDILEQARPGTRPVRLCLRGDLIDRLRQLETELVAAIALEELDAGDDLSPGIAQQIVELEAEMDRDAVEFLVRAIGAQSWQEILALHPPDEAAREAGWSYGVGFPHAAIAACTTTKVGDEVAQLTDEQMARLGDLLTDGQFRRLWSATLDLNTGAGDVPKSAAAYAVMAGSVLRSRTASLTGSPGRSS